MAAATTELETAVLALEGDENGWSARIAAELEQIGERPVRLVLDLDDTVRIDARALGTLVLALKRVERAGGRLTLECSRPEQLELLRRTRLDRFFGVAAC